MEEFRESFPIVTFEDVKPSIEEVKRGEFRALLHEPPIEWAMTRGTTGKSKHNRYAREGFLGLINKKAGAKVPYNKTPRILRQRWCR